MDTCINNILRLAIHNYDIDLITFMISSKMIKKYWPKGYFGFEVFPYAFKENKLDICELFIDLEYHLVDKLLSEAIDEDNIPKVKLLVERETCLPIYIINGAFESATKRKYNVFKYLMAKINPSFLDDIKDGLEDTIIYKLEKECTELTPQYSREIGELCHFIKENLVHILNSI